MLIGPLEQIAMSRNEKIFTQENEFENGMCKMSAICLDPNGLMLWCEVHLSILYVINNLKYKKISILYQPSAMILKILLQKKYFSGSI